MKKISFGKISFGQPKTSNPQFESGNETDTAFAGFGSFGKKPETSKSSDAPPAASEEPKELNEDDEMARVMGFGSFGGKKAKKFDLDSVLKSSLQTAVERNKDGIEKLTELSLASTAEKAGRSDSTAAEGAGEDDADLIGPPAPRPAATDGGDSDGDDGSADDDEELSDDEDEDPQSWIPQGQELVLEHGRKPVTALAADPAGARLVSGSQDFTIKYWDFNGMDVNRRCFREMRPFDCHAVSAVQCSASGDRVLAVAACPQLKVLDRDGAQLLETPRGDMYLVDMAATSGHVSAVAGCAWHPRDREEFLTCARDGTCRIWQAETAAKKQTHVVKPRAAGGLKTHPSACAYSRDGSLVAAACTDGSLQMWDHRKNYVNTSLLVRDGHQRGTETSSLVFSYDNLSVATRGGDETLKLWDLRQFRKPVHTAGGLFNRFSTTDCVFSPNDQLVVTGTSLERGETEGSLHFFRRDTFEKVAQLPVASSHVISTIWHPRINQIVVGCGDGSCKVVYDPLKSHRGALLSAGKKRSKAKQVEVMKNTQVITPHALPMFREPRAKSTHKQLEKARQDPKLSRRPDLPQGNAGTGGRVSAGGSTLSNYIMRTLGKEAKAREEGDPREALLKHAKEAAENPYWVTPAYAKTQPKQIFQPTPSDEPDPKRQKS